jgi:hypothetical protein
MIKAFGPGGILPYSNKMDVKTLMKDKSYTKDFVNINKTPAEKIDEAVKSGKSIIDVKA